MRSVPWKQMMNAAVKEESREKWEGSYINVEPVENFKLITLRPVPVKN